MKLKNIIPYWIAHQFWEYNSIYITSIIKGYNNDIKNNLLGKNYFLGELDIVYYMAINHRRTDIIDFFEHNKSTFNNIKKLFVYESAKMNYPLIVEKYLNIKKPNKNNRFLFLLLEIATLHASYEVVEILLKYGLDFKQKNYSCIRTVVSSGNFELFKLYHKYNLNIKKNEYIFTAILKDNQAWFNYILQNGFEINESNKEVIYNFLGFNGSINIIEQEKMNLMKEKDLMLKASYYNPISKKWCDKFYKKVDFYNKLDNKFENKENLKNKKVNKI